MEQVDLFGDPVIEKRRIQRQILEIKKLEWKFNTPWSFWEHFLEKLDNGTIGDEDMIYVSTNQRTDCSLMSNFWLLFDELFETITNGQPISKEVCTKMTEEIDLIKEFWKDNYNGLEISKEF
ncbi:MAG: hypothetical protein ACRDE7_00280 [Sphingobacterium sp.]